MHYSFTAYGHPNITGTHKATLEFTKDKEITKNASCIIGVNSDFDPERLKDIAKNSKRIKITIRVGSLSEEIYAEANPDFSDEKELVIRISGFISGRTFAIKADKACSGMDRGLLRIIQQKSRKIAVNIQKI